MSDWQGQSAQVRQRFGTNRESTPLSDTQGLQPHFIIMKGYEDGLAACALYATFVCISREEEALLSAPTRCVSQTEARDGTPDEGASLERR